MYFCQDNNTGIVSNGTEVIKQFHFKEVTRKLIIFIKIFFYSPGSNDF